MVRRTIRRSVRYADSQEHEINMQNGGEVINGNGHGSHPASLTLHDNTQTHSKAGWKHVSVRGLNASSFLVSILVTSLLIQIISRLQWLSKSTKATAFVVFFNLIEQKL